VASSMFVFTMACTPHAASSRESPRGRAIRSSMARAAVPVCSRIAPPAKYSGFR